MHTYHIFQGEGIEFGREIVSICACRNRYRRSILSTLFLEFQIIKPKLIL